MKRIFTTVCLVQLLLVASAAQSQPGSSTQATEFLRLQQGEEEYAGRLQTAITSYRNEQGVELDLVAAIHIGDQDYFQLLNDYFDTRDAVLYELVADANVRPAGNDDAGVSGFTGMLQLALTRFLALQYQLHTVNYQRSNFIHADLQPAELERILQEKGETLFTAMLNLALEEMAYQQAQATRTGNQTARAPDILELIRVFNSSDRRNGIKFLLARALADSGGGFAQRQGGGADSTILDDRNAVALETLVETLRDSSHTEISIFYGAAHMNGLERGISELGFEKVSQRWIDAWQMP